MNKNRMLKGILWFFEGIIVGFGAIMPGISGGTLCVAFGMYKPLIETLSAPRGGVRKYWKMLGVFLLGAGTGFLGLSGLASWLMEQNMQAVTCAFIGFILGTFPELWKDAGRKGRRRGSYFAMLASFLAMLGLLCFFKTYRPVTIQPDLWGFLLCGLLWGISFVVPGLSSSTLLLFFGLYQPMLDGIAKSSLAVLCPLAVGVALCLLLLPKAVNTAFQKWYSIISHVILGIVAATTIMIIPDFHVALSGVLVNLLCIGAGIAISYTLGRICARLKRTQAV